MLEIELEWKLKPKLPRNISYWKCYVTLNYVPYALQAKNYILHHELWTTATATATVTATVTATATAVSKIYKANLKHCTKATRTMSYIHVYARSNKLILQTTY